MENVALANHQIRGEIVDSSKHGKEKETLPPDLSGSLHLQGMFIFTVQTYQQRKAGSLTGKDEDIKIKNKHIEKCNANMCNGI